MGAVAYGIALLGHVGVQALVAFALGGDVSLLTSTDVSGSWRQRPPGPAILIEASGSIANCRYLVTDLNAGILRKALTSRFMSFLQLWSIKFATNKIYSSTYMFLEIAHLQYLISGEEYACLTRTRMHVSGQAFLFATTPTLLCKV